MACPPYSYDILLANTHSIHRYSPAFDLRENGAIAADVFKDLPVIPSDHLLLFSAVQLY